MSKRPRSGSDTETPANHPRLAAKKASILVAQVEKTPIKILEHLLDMTHVPPSTEASHFQTLATTLMQSFHLCVSNRSTPPVITSYELLEVEFYWNCEETGHTDPFVGIAGERNVPGNWYFCTPQQAAHARKPNKSDPSPNTDRGQDWTREGLYLTFGIPSPSCSSRTDPSDPPLSDHNKPVRAAHGGILFRALRDIFTETAAVGPSVLVENVLRASGSRNISSLADEAWGGDMYALGKGGPGRMFLRPISGSLLAENRTRDKPTIYRSPRIGLDLSDIPSPSHATSFNPRVQYLMRPYRFIQRPHLLGFTGAQTIYCLLTYGVSCSEIATLVNDRLFFVEMAAKYLEAGRKKGERGVKELVGEEGKRATYTMQRCMNMIGIVESILKEGDIKERGQATAGCRAVLKVAVSEMSATEVFDCLLEHGCVDISSNMNLAENPPTIVGGGGFGDVLQGKLTDGEKVAIKCLRFAKVVEDRPKGLKRLMRETYMWSKVEHDNVQQLMGIIMFQGRLGLVSLWREHGNMQDYIRKNPGVDRHRLCVQVTSGVSYLHNIGMVHGDIKTMNILVSADGVAKLNDFDHSILSNCSLAFSSTSNFGGGTLRWMAPELLSMVGKDEVSRTTQADVYALAMTILEIFTGNVPYAEYRRDVAIYGVLSRKELPTRPEVLMSPTTHADEMWSLLVNCWNHDPRVRPDILSVLSSLRCLNVKPPSGM